MYIVIINWLSKLDAELMTNNLMKLNIFIDPYIICYNLQLTINSKSTYNPAFVLVHTMKYPGLIHLVFYKKPAIRNLEFLRNMDWKFIRMTLRSIYIYIELVYWVLSIFFKPPEAKFFEIYALKTYQNGAQKNL